MSEHESYSPTPEFRDRLEWEVTSAFRRAQRRSSDRLATWRPRLRAAAVLLVALALGTSAGLASAQMAGASRRDSLLQAAQAELALAAVRLDLTRGQLEDAQRKAAVGIADATAVAKAESEHHAMEAAARRAQLNIEEIRASAQAPRNDLNAPLVNGRDFVTERLRLDLFVAQQHLTSAEQAVDQARRRERVGATGAIERLEAEAAATRARAELGTLAERQNLRREFLEKATPVDQLLRRQELAEVRMEAMAAQSELAVARERLEIIEKARAAGSAEELDVLRARVELREREIELHLLATRLREMRVQQPASQDSLM